MVSKLSAHALGIHPGPTASLPKPQNNHTLNVPSSILCRFPSYQTSVSELPLAQISCLCGFPHHDLDTFAYIIFPLFLQLDSGSLAQCLAVDLCISFHQLLEKGSVMTIKVVIIILTG